MKKFLLLFLTTTVLADPVELTCTPPTTFDDGSPLTIQPTYIFYWGNTQGGPYTESDTAADCSYTADVPQGTWYFVATAIVDGKESLPSNEAVKVVLGTPSAPTDLVVVPGNLTAFGISQSVDRLVLFPVGEVIESTQCDGTISVNGLYRVPISSVTYQSTVRPPVVFAACGSGS